MNIGTGRKAREMALQILYQSELNEISVAEALLLQCEHFEIVKKAIPYAKSLAEGVASHFTEINQLIKEHARNWRLERMSVIDRNIIRVAVFELCFQQEETPATIVINEAIEVAKHFGADDSSSFINGILDAVNRSRNIKKKE
jgi:N utilization substance protein B